MKKISFKTLIVVVLGYSLMVLAQEDAAWLEHEEELARAQKSEEFKALDALREAEPSTTEYTLSPGQVQMVVELEPAQYGWGGRNFRTSFGSDFDLLFRGRAALRAEYRFFEYFSGSFHMGVDWSRISLYERFRQHIGKPAPQQLSLLGGISGKWRLTEWYLHSSIFLEPSLFLGHMWQQLVEQKSTHWRMMPGAFVGIDTVFDSGLALQFKMGIEFPIDFAKENPIKDVAQPLMMFGLGLAL